MEIRQHRLVDVPFETTPNQGGEISPEFLILHYTVTQSARGTVAGFKREVSQASAHLVLDYDGKLTQMVAFNHVAWHAGKSEWQGRSRVNGFSIGIEIVNPGPVLKGPNGFVDTNRRPWTGEVVAAKHKHGRVSWEHWAAYTTEQLEILRELAALLARTYQLKDVLGHDDIAPGRKFDPGPAFPLESIRSSMQGRHDDTPDRWFTSTVLNVRQGPAVSHPTVTGSPLAKGREVLIADEDGAWRHVMTPDGAVEGWVHGRYLVVG